jgi:hypothetical protein
MFSWCRLEDALAEALRAATGAQPRSLRGGFNEQFAKLSSHLTLKLRGNEALSRELADLVERIDRVRRERNLIVHGLAGVSASPREVEPHIICREGEQGRPTLVRITQTELTTLIESVARCRSDLEHIDHLTRSLPARST